MKDLINLYAKYSGDNCKDIRDYITKRLNEMNVPYMEYKGNIYNFNDAPLISAHMDQVPTNGPAVHFYKNKDIITGYNKNYDRTNLGADDKNGVWIILKLLESAVPISFCISVGEESGCLGIHDMQNGGILDTIKSPYCIVCDRRGDSEILEKGGQGNYCFSLARNLVAFLSRGYTIGSGSVSDTGILADYLECVNISTGYMQAHTQNEFTDWEALQRILLDVKEIVLTYEHNYPAKKEMYRNVYDDIRKKYSWDKQGSSSSGKTELEWF